MHTPILAYVHVYKSLYVSSYKLTSALKTYICVYEYIYIYLHISNLINRLTPANPSDVETQQSRYSMKALQSQQPANSKVRVPFE